MDEAAIEAKGLGAAQAAPRSDRRHQESRRNWRTRWARRLRADVDALNNTNFHTINLFGLMGRARLQRFRALRALPDAGRHRSCRIATTTCATAST